jgi:predicted ATP-binding protein involved in virulence
MSASICDEAGGFGMFFHKLSIRDFRCFTGKTILLGKYVTVLAGRNSTGKSTVLGMLGNATEMKKNVGRTYFSRQFRAEFSELFKGSKDHDPTGADKFRLSLADESGHETESRQFRVAWQAPRKSALKNVENEQGKQRKNADKKDLRTRFRVIPSYHYNEHTKYAIIKGNARWW